MTDDEIFHKWLKGNTEAIELVDMLAGISQTWDDLIDQDKMVDGKAINEMMIDALIYLPQNKFYQQFPQLHCMFDHAISTWQESNFIEKEQHEMLHVSFINRSVITPLIMYIIQIIGGRAWRLEAAKEIYPIIFDEPFEDYKKEHMQDGM